MTTYPKSARIIEVGPRDGLQNEKAPVKLADKLHFIELLAASGLKEIEAGSFVRVDRIPQMADSEKVFESLKGKQDGITYTALVPNEKGMDAALAAGVKKIAVFTAASESFNQRNINASIAESFARFKPVLARARTHGMQIRGYVSTALVCPYEGDIAPEQVLKVVSLLEDEGISDISLGDTIGAGTPPSVCALLECVLGRFPLSHFAMHFHDTYGTALANVHASLEFGVTNFDASTAGLGGCPYADGASGNLATNDLVWFLHKLGVQTGIDLDKLQEAGAFIQKVLGKTLPSHLQQIHASRKIPT